MATALVTGASRGVGRGVAAALAGVGFRVVAVGRTVERADLPAGVVRVTADLATHAGVEALFAGLAGETVDVVVNSAWGGYERMVEEGAFTWGEPFWRQPAHRWTGMMDAGVRAAYFVAARAAEGMVARGRGLIVNISFWAARKYVGNAIYGISKAATDKMSADMAHELRPHGVAAVSLYPGLVRTEAVLEAARAGWLDLSNSESPEFTGLVVARLWEDARLMEKSGQPLVVAELAREFGVADVDGRSPEPLGLDSV